MSETLTVEELWQRAHELVRRGDFANAVRDLSLCYQTLQERQDPRLYEVHKRWTEVHQMYLEDGARPSPPQQPASASLEAEAEAAANAGDLEGAIARYQQAAAASPGNELVRERLGELRAARARAAELSSPVRPAAAASPRAEDDWSDVDLDMNAAAPATAPAVGPTAAPVMAAEDAPVGMQSLDVPFSVGDVIAAAAADDLPVVGAPSQLPGAASQAALLEELLARVQANRRRVA
ncbi:MAG: hypothetical protein HYS27_05795 [Deltaproteobacteria bacterium]|nr:hypothetical protein [Deltaproteobacteria bacterium]